MKRSLRTRLILALLPLPVLILGVGGLTIWMVSLVHEQTPQSNSAELALIQEATVVIEEAQRIGFAIQLSLDGLPGSRAEIADAAAVIREAIGRIESTAFETAEGKTEMILLADEIHQLLGVTDALHDAPIDVAAFLRFSEARDNLLAQALALTRFNERSMAGALAASRRTTGAVAVATIAAVLAALGLVVYVSYRFHARILRPIDAYVGATVAISEGDFQAPVPKADSKEFGRLAEALREMTIKLQEHQKLIDAELVRARMVFTALFANLPAGVAFFDREGRPQHVNPVWERMLDQDRPARRPRLEAALITLVRQVLDSGEAILPMGFKDAIQCQGEGGERSYLARAFLVQPHLAESGVGVIVEDITSLRLAADLKDDLVATVSHELKTPITSAQLSLYVLSDEAYGDLTETQRELVESAKDELARQIAMIERLLELGRLEGGERPGPSARVDSRLLLERSCQEHQRVAAQRALALELTVPEALPEVLGEEEQLIIVLNNFVGNAVKYAPRGSTIRMDGRVEEGSVVFSVSDEGPGLAEADRTRVFEKFFRAGNRSAPGVGLGLCIAREIARHHGGAVACESQLGVGSTFSLRLPSAPARGATVGPSSAVGAESD